MATIKISQLPPAPDGTGSGSSKGTDLFPATDTTDTSSAASGTTKKYTLSEIFNFILSAQGLTTYTAVRVSTTGALTVTYSNGAAGVGATLTNATTQAALNIDGIAVSVGDRVLVWQQASTLQNGIYTVTNIGSVSTNWVMTRATDYDQASEIVQFGVMLVNQGATYSGKLFQETGAGPFTIGTTPIIFALYSSSGQVNSGTINDLAYYAASGDVISPLATANDGLLVTSNTGVPSILAGPGTTGKILQSNASAAPSFSTASYPSVATSTGTLLRADGTNWVHTTATFADTYGASTLLYSNGANTVTGLATSNSAMFRTNSSGVPGWTASATDGQLLIGSTGATPTLATLTEGSNITITNAAGSITISSTSGGSGTVNPGTANQLAYYATTGDAVSGLTSANDGLLVTDNSGVPSILAGPGATGRILQSNSAAAPSFSTASYPSTTTANEILYSSSNNVVAQIASTAGGVLITNNTNVPSMLANPSATGRFLQSVNGAASVWSSAAFPTSAGAAGTILRSDGTNWLASAATFANTYSASTLLYSNGANAVTGLATANSAVLVTSSAGVPSWSSTMTNGQVIIGSTGSTPVAAVLTQGSGISITNGAGSITITNTSPGSGTVDPGLQNQLAYYAADGSEVSGLSTGNNGLLVTSSIGVPSIGNAIGADITVSGMTVGIGGGSQNSVIGLNAAASNTTGVSNVVFGANAMPAGDGADYSVIIGTSAMLNATAPGQRNIVIGYLAGSSVDYASDSSVAIGPEALKSLTTGNFNVAVGDSAMKNSTTAQGNTALGYASMLALTTGAGNVGVGSGIMLSGAGVTGSFNTVVGTSSLSVVTSGTQNTVIGYSALTSLTTADGNVAIGVQSMSALVTGDSNLVIGSSGAQLLNGGSDNVCIGSSVAPTLVNGQINTIIGDGADVDGASTSGSIALGSGAIGLAATGSSPSTNGASCSIGSVGAPVGFRGDGTIYSGGTGRGYWRPILNGTPYLMPCFIDGTLTASAAMVTDTNGSPILTASMTDGQVVIGKTGSTPVTATISGGAGITVTNGSGTITISGTGGGLAWTGIAGTSQSADINTGYVVQNASQTTITLPATFSIGDVVAIKGLGAAGWILQSAMGTIIHVGQLPTSDGGTVTSADNYDVIYVSGLIANTEWSMDSSVTTGFTVA